MKILIQEIYRCDFCNKPLTQKGFMVLHEKMCKNNPHNKHKCFEGCKFLQRVPSDYEDVEFNFFCAKNGVNMHSYRFERWHKNKVKIQEMELVRMPLECSDYQPETFENIQFPF